MKDKKIARIYLAVIFVICVGFAFYYYINYDVEVSAIYKKTSNCAKIELSGNKQSCYLNHAKTEKNSKICDIYFEQKDSREFCYSLVAQASGDSLSCARLSNSNERDNCYSGIAKANSSESLCSSITDEYRVSECYYNMAIQKKEITLCEKVTPPELHEDCYKEVTSLVKEPSTCEKVKDGKDNILCYSFYCQKDTGLMSSSTVSEKCWQIYKNTEYGFQFKYPSNHSIVAEGLSKRSMDSNLIYFILFSWTDQHTASPHYLVSVYKTGQKGSFDEYIQNLSGYELDEPVKYTGPIIISENPLVHKYTTIGYYEEIFAYYGFIGPEYTVYFSGGIDNTGSSGINIESLNKYNLMENSIKNSFIWLK
jgi:hypothetical protein